MLPSLFFFRHAFVCHLLVIVVGFGIAPFLFYSFKVCIESGEDAQAIWR
jgi:hypothetical protein